LAKTIAAKLKLKSMRQVFKNLGYDIKTEDPISKKTYKFDTPDLRRTPRKFLTKNEIETDPLNIVN